MSNYPEFVAAIQHLIQTSIIHVENADEGPRLAELRRQLEECSEYAKAYEWFDCEKAAAVEHMLLISSEAALGKKVIVFSVCFRMSHGRPLLVALPCTTNTF